MACLPVHERNQTVIQLTFSVNTKRTNLQFEYTMAGSSPVVTGYGLVAHATKVSATLSSTCIPPARALVAGPPGETFTPPPSLETESQVGIRCYWHRSFCCLSSRPFPDGYCGSGRALVLTMGPAYYGCYRLGAWLPGAPDIDIGKNFNPTIEWLFHQTSLIWQPLVAGSLVISTITGFAGYILVQIAWRGTVIRSKAKQRHH